MIPLYCQQGKAVAYADDACLALYLTDGTFAAWLDDGFLYAPDGRYLGWIHQGWVLDRSGRPALFADNASGRPVRPPVSAPSAGFWPRAPQRPQRVPIRGARPARRGRVAEWSPLTGLAFFHQRIK
ncbi:4-fold beta flower protein [Hymenobacter sp. CRA2]|uniref:4-fold beta flower protein n=1 Tax=Hymenobacter sp. CRA2 TaxID=1955620 RepID=UPI0011169A56|nr:hypothetical protein [Hymenobacter sp. CRA2]